MLSSCVLTVIALLVAIVTFAESRSLARGFPEDIHWVSYEDGLAQGKAQHKKIMVLIHSSWCTACSDLKKEISENKDTKEIVKLSRHFVMVNVEDEEEPYDKAVSLDGRYTPRIVFLYPDGRPMSIDNRLEHPNYKYYYDRPEDILSAMKRALKL
ncbi:hypothetical protein AB6A40_001740 [Gnathostoma spinigerum]|uniref:Thioredoxin domain-containing protein n=1 Tax=Gnathostoma spinigerum TaxID=75299 RepID=A0ABD6E790_9BILA